MVRSRLCLIGAPWDGSSSFVRGAAAAPPRIREALWSDSTNSSTELGIAIEPDTFDDRGDLPIPGDAAGARMLIEQAVTSVVLADGIPVVLGGDHSISYPALRAFKRQPPATILHIDAHGDLYDEFGGDRHSHACPFARIMEEGLTHRLVQVGIRTATPHLRAQAARFGVEVHGPHRLADVPVESLQGPLYVSLDLDGLDPAYAPGVAHPEPGGLSTRDVVQLLHRIRAPIAGADVVEYNPSLDTRDLTARVAAKLLKELMAVAIRNRTGPWT